jgi:hypothetical protein
MLQGPSRFTGSLMAMLLVAFRTAERRTGSLWCEMSCAAAWRWFALRIGEGSLTALWIREQGFERSQ